MIGEWISGEMSVCSSLHEVSIMMASKHTESNVKQVRFMIFLYLVVVLFFDDANVRILSGIAKEYGKIIKVFLNYRLLVFHKYYFYPKKHI